MQAPVKPGIMIHKVIALAPHLSTAIPIVNSKQPDTTVAAAYKVPMLLSVKPKSLI